MTLTDDYRLTLEGDLGAGAPDNLPTRITCFLWAFRRWIKG